MSYALSLRLFPDRVDLARLTSTKTFGSVEESYAVAATDLPCCLVEPPAYERIEQGAEGSDADSVLLFRSDPQANPGDLLYGKGVHLGRTWVVKKRRTIQTADTVRWALDCAERT